MNYGWKTAWWGEVGGALSFVAFEHCLDCPRFLSNQLLNVDNTDLYMSIVEMDASARVAEKVAYLVAQLQGTVHEGATCHKRNDNFAHHED